MVNEGFLLPYVSGRIGVQPFCLMECGRQVVQANHRVASRVINAGQGERLTGTDDRAIGKIGQVRNDDIAIYDQLSREYERFQHVNRMFELVAKVVSPTVVHIVTSKSQRTRKFEETGSGVIVRSDKNSGLYVLTNHHVVEGGNAGKIRIFLQDGRALVPTRILSDAKADVAVLKL